MSFQRFMARGKKASSRTAPSTMVTPSTENLRGPAAARDEIPLRDLAKQTTGSSAATDEVAGTTRLFDGGGRLRHVPMPTPSPHDPLNLPPWRKWAAVAALSFFGALALAGEFIVGALVPVFVLEYSGIDPKILADIDLSAFTTGPSGAINLNPLDVLSALGGPPVWKVALLSSLPLLMNGIASYFLVPFSIAVGRRPVLLLVGVLAWAGGLWASFTTTLGAHLAARAFQGLGAGAVEALIPLIVQDMMFIHERNRAISLISAGQGLFIVSLGIASPVIVARLSWRYIYWITAGLGIFAWILLIVLVPETRFIRSDAELAGKEVYPLYPGETRPRLDVHTYGPRTKKTDFGVFHLRPEWARARRAVWDTIKTTFFPNVLWVILVNSIFVSVQGAAGQVGSSLLIAAGWQFEDLGLAVVPIVVACPFVWLAGGWGADKVSNWHARRWTEGGKREPEAHLLSLVVPLLCGVAGPVLFGYAGENIATVSTYVLLLGIFLIGFAYLTANALFSVYLVESYPAYAGPVLVNVSSCRLIIGFAMSFDATTWVQDLGFLRSFGAYSGALGATTLGLPLVYFYGKRIRAFTAGKFLGGGGGDGNKNTTAAAAKTGEGGMVYVTRVDDEEGLRRARVGGGDGDGDGEEREEEREVHVVEVLKGDSRR